MADTPGLALFISQRLIVPALPGMRLSTTGLANGEAPWFTIMTPTLSPLVIARIKALLPVSCAETSAPPVIPSKMRKVTNSAAYNAALYQRGSLKARFTDDAVANWTPKLRHLQRSVQSCVGEPPDL